MPLSIKKLMLIENSVLKYNLMQNRRCWIHEINLSRPRYGEFERLYKELRSYDDKFHSYLRMKQNTFDILLGKVKDRLQKKDTAFRYSITPEERLVITIRFLATGESYRSLAFHFRMGRSTIAEIVNETCEIIWIYLKKEYMPLPNAEKWIEISKKFYEQWNFPNCIGAIDGKHIRINCPANSGSSNYNYKQYFSILLQALVDADGKFIFVDIGAEGRQCDAGNFRSSSLFNFLQNGQLNIPNDREIPGTNITMPFVIVGDGGYPLLNYLMRPFGQRNLDNQKRIYNYRLSRARRSVECCFGMMAQKWRVLLKAIETNVETAKLISKAVCILHNFIMTHESQHENRSNQELQLQQGSFVSNTFQQRPQHRFASQALQTREILVDYFNGCGAVPWQNNFALPENIIMNT